jgi:GTP cyclohydrolase II
VLGRVPLVTPVTRHNARYIATKQDKLGHWPTQASGAA